MSSEKKPREWFGYIDNQDGVLRDTKMDDFAKYKWVEEVIVREVTPSDERKDAYIAMLEEQLKNMSEALKFYADETAWDHSEEYHDCDDFLKISSSDEIQKEHCKDSVGGRRAKVSLQKCAQIRASFEEGGDKL